MKTWGWIFMLSSLGLVWVRRSGLIIVSSARRLRRRAIESLEQPAISRFRSIFAAENFQSRQAFGFVFQCRRRRRVVVLDDDFIFPCLSRSQFQPQRQ